MNRSIIYEVPLHRLPDMKWPFLLLLQAFLLFLQVCNRFKVKLAHM